MANPSQKIALVLSSGGARGLAHIGAIEVLQENGYSIASISGSSMGALVGGLFAAGKLEEFKKWAEGMDKMDILSLIDFTISNKGIVKGEKVFDKMQKLNMIPDINIEDLPIPYTAVAVDIINNKKVIFTKGSLIKAIRASISIPSVFTPMPYTDSLLVDGGVLSPLPIEHIHRTKGDMLVAVDVNALIPYNKPFLSNEEGDKTWLNNEKIQALFKKWDNLFGHEEKDSEQKVKKPSNKNIGYYSLLVRSLQLMQTQLTQYAIELQQPKLVIPISQKSATAFEFYRSKELIEYGRIQCRKALKKL